MNPDITDRYTFWSAIFGGLKFSLNTFGTSQVQIQRMLSVGSLKKAQTALFLSMPLIVLFNLFNYWDGVALYGMFHNCDPLLDENTHLTSQDQLLPYAIVKLFGSTPGLSGLCIAGVFSASLSTVSSIMNSLTAVTMEDVVRPYCICKKLSETWMAFLAKTIALMYGIVTLLVVFVVANFRGVFEASNIMFGMIGGPIFGLYTLGMFVKTANQWGSLIGLIVGLIVNSWLGFGSSIYKAKMPTLKRSVEGCANITSTFGQNSTAYLQPTNTSNTEQNDRYVLPVYKISFQWFPLLGFLTVIIVGVIASWSLRKMAKSELKPELFSPLIRKYYFGTIEDKTEKNLQMHVTPQPFFIYKDDKKRVQQTNT